LLLQDEGARSFAARALVTLASTWLLFCFCNFTFSYGCLSSIENRRAPSVGELVQMGRIGVGASRPDDVPAQKAPDKSNTRKAVPKRATLLNGLFVMNGSVSRLAPKRLNSSIVTHCNRLILADLNGDPVKDRADDVVSIHTRIVLECLRVKHVIGSAHQAYQMGQFPRSPEFYVQRLAGVEQSLQGVDPLEMEEENCLEELRKVEKELAGLREALTAVVGLAIPKPGELWSNEPLKNDGWRNFYTDIQQMIPGDSHPRIALGDDQRPPRSELRPELTILFFPDTEPAQRYALGLEISHTSTWRIGNRNGYNVEAQFFVVALDRPNQPIRPPRSPSITVLHREPWWCGLRPIAVHVSEEQLANRFFDECTTIARGAGIKPKLVPTNEERKAEYNRAIQYLLEKRLGGEATAEAWTREPGDLRDSHLPARTLTLDEIVVWPRRLNGGTWWGCIQFSVVYLGLFFLLELIRVNRLIELCLKPKQHGKLPSDIQTALQGVTSKQPAVHLQEAQEVCERVSDRMTGMRYIVTALPLVGFLGSVAGLSNSLIGASGISSDIATERQSSLQEMQIALGTAFDKSILAFVMTIICLGGLFFVVRRIGDLRTRL
jgi:hypothetical protein